MELRPRIAAGSRSPPPGRLSDNRLSRSIFLTGALLTPPIGGKGRDSDRAMDRTEPQRPNEESELAAARLGLSISATDLIKRQNVDSSRREYRISKCFISFIC